VKLVYYGPALSGKTTNLQAIHRLVAPESSGRLMTLETRDDRTLFFDLLPLSFDAGNGIQVRIKLFTVPGQVIHNATRRLVLQGADGTAFIADSQRAETRANQAAFLNMQENLQENGIDPSAHPLVIQFNKRDMLDVRTDEELDRMASRGREPVYKAVAIRGAGVVETFLGLLDLTWSHLERDHQLHAKFGLEPERFLRNVRTRLGVVPGTKAVSR
ncbi:MAG: gliding motility protein, partial [Polyangiaceae bacterium]|nr:gliding motility protein [Polyangiaceae bacterium]